MTARAPEECDRLFGEHVNAGDLAALMSLYEPTASMVRRNGTLARGPAEIRAVLDRLLAIRARMSIEIVKVVQAGEDLAMVYSDWRMSGKSADGQPITAAGRAIEVVRRQPDGTWRFVLDDPYARGSGG